MAQLDNVHSARRDDSDKGKNITYVAILADAACSAALHAGSREDVIDELPAGCTIVATVPIHVR